MKKREKMSDELKRKIGNANKGKVRSLETRIKIGNNSRGRIASAETRRKIGLKSKGNTYARKDKSTQYVTIHNHVREMFGTPETCETCCKTALYGSNIHWANKDHTYRLPIVREDWMRLCMGCHLKYDYEHNRRGKRHDS